MDRLQKLDLSDCLHRVPDRLWKRAEEQRAAAGFPGEEVQGECRVEPDRWNERRAARLLLPEGFHFQVPIFLRGVVAPWQRPRSSGTGFIMDFFNPEARLCVEIDGAHYHDPEYDGLRDKVLNSVVGIETMRVAAVEVDQQTRYGGDAYWFRRVIAVLRARNA